MGWEQWILLHGVDTYELNDGDDTKRALAVKAKEKVAARVLGEV